MKVAVVGSGIAGLSAAWHLQAQGCDVTLFESNGRLGGHTHTHELAVKTGEVRVDTGFIVFNEQNYPEFSRWLGELGVAHKGSDMSFAVRDDINHLEYGTTNLRAIFANYRQLARPAFWSMWKDLFRFYNELGEGPIPDVTLGEYLAQHRYGDAFVDSHIAPMCSALWSQPAEQSLVLSLRHVGEFMRNHRMLQIAARPHWRVVEGGSASYIDAFERRFQGRIHRLDHVHTVKRGVSGVTLVGSTERRFDAAVLACHSNQSLDLLEEATPDERRILSAIPYQTNHVYLHEDASFMPRNRDCWSSWNVTRESDGAYTITYWMNRLQGLPCRENFFVTLNPQSVPKDIRWEGDYQHPHFTKASFNAQKAWPEIADGVVQYAGAYWGAGFHEDGLVSGMRAAKALLQSGCRNAA